MNKKSQAKPRAHEPAENKSKASPSSARAGEKQLLKSAPAKLVLVRKTLEKGLFGSRPGDDVLDGAIGPILRAGEQRVALLEQLRNAVKSGDKKLVFEIAERYCGLTA